MESHHATTVHGANGTTKKNIYNEDDPSTSSEGRPLVSSWLPIIENSLYSLLRWTGSYPAEVQESHLTFVREAVVPCLKPPAAADKLHYIGTHHHGPFEASVAFASHKKAKVRFAVQPLINISPGGDDPMGEKEMRKKIENLASACNADRTWLNPYIDSVFLTSQEEKTLLDKHASGGGAGSPLPRQICFVGFDLESEVDKNGKAAITFKVYLFPQLKALATGQKLEDITESVVERLAEGDKEMLAAWKLLRKFLESDAGDYPYIYFLAIDCLAPHKKPRFKVYVHTRFNSLATARNVFTLGGLLPPASADFVPQVWPLLLDMEDIPLDKMDGMEKPLNDPESKYCGLCFAFALVPGQAVPQVKVYVPMWQYARDEPGIVERYQRILETQGKMGDYDVGSAFKCAL
ncbi:4-O-dimethylallyl-L-tyrosine synthase 2 [Colletotrichum chlorophyti]|uniref:4-O-dimethylallyl-L-tyrosine synthase 2 n=1 Tax=Colletotrichum chlorophyti TaxID=708187 RepID=A0A1Q8RZV7_9PEZI|nr:4-O-dimethylallyl-L-tyrosine synthase 2 [Colletotrichum chlorophyti]